MAKQRIDWKRVWQWMVALGRRMAKLTARVFHAARHEASKEKYREYLSEAYGQMRERYPAVENTAKEALDAIGVRPRTRTQPQTKKKTAARKTTGKKTSAKKKKTTRKTTASKKKAGRRKKAA